MKVILIVHHYAPELNVARVLNKHNKVCGEVKCPGITTTKAFRTMFRPVAPRVFAQVWVEYEDDKLKHLNRHCCGVIEQRKDLLGFIHMQRRKSNAGPCKVRAVTRLVG